MRKEFTCATCGETASRHSGEVNRSVRRGWPLYCSRECFQVTQRTSAQEKAEYRKEYGKKYRAEHPTPNSYWAQWYAKNREKSLAEAKAWYEQNKSTVADRGHRWRAATKFGPFAEAYLVFLDLSAELRRLMPDHYERFKARGHYDRQNERRKARRRA